MNLESQGPENPTKPRIQKNSQNKLDAVRHLILHRSSTSEQEFSQVSQRRARPQPILQRDGLRRA